MEVVGVQLQVIIHWLLEIISFHEGLTLAMQSKRCFKHKIIYTTNYKVQVIHKCFIVLSYFPNDLERGGM